MKDFNLAVGQWRVEPEKERNLEQARSFLREAAGKGADLCVLPEMFQTPYELPAMRAGAESQGGPTLTAVRDMARELKVHIVSGSFCEKLEDRYYNSSYLVDPRGELVGVCRKIHLFDVSLGTVEVKESSLFTPGDRPLVAELPFCKLGVAVCYDARFPAVFRHFEGHGVEVIAIPAAFSRTTGAAHWHSLMRSRAFDYQAYLVAACPAPNERSSYVAYGHSLVVDPWGTVLAEAGEGNELLLARASAEKVEHVRRSLPVLRHRRETLYRSWDEGR